MRVSWVPGRVKNRAHRIITKSGAIDRLEVHFTLKGQNVVSGCWMKTPKNWDRIRDIGERVKGSLKSS